MPEQPIDSTLTDDLSPLARDLLQLNLQDAYSRLVVTGPGHDKARQLLNPATHELLLSAPVVSRDDGKALLAGLWLWHDWLDDSHRISQSLHDATGSFWHAIMHRREGDFANSQYWYARCRDHPALTALAGAVGAILNPQPADKAYLRLTSGGWNPNAFVGLVEQVHEQPSDPRHKVCISLQQLEWRLLFDHCIRAAVGR